MSENTMFYEIIPGDRHFNKDQLYSDIAWTKLNEVVDAFGKRIRDWYFDPAKEMAKNGHFAFSVMALNCLVIDTLSQFVCGTDLSSGATYKQFIKARLPNAYSIDLDKPIRHCDGKHSTDLRDVADVLYHGFRCGILHQAHITPYGLVDPGLCQPVCQNPSGHVKYKSCGSDCPSVVLNPLQLLCDLSNVFENYLANLKNRDSRYDELRVNFKNKFARSFGVDVRSAV